MYGIPTMKLSKKVVQRRLDLMAAEGIVFKTGINIGQDVSAQEIKDEHDAMLLCMGATWPRDLPIEGRNSAGGKDYQFTVMSSRSVNLCLSVPLAQSSSTISIVKP